MPSDAAGLHLAVDVDVADGESCLKAILALVTQDRKEKAVTVLRTDGSASRSGYVRLAGSIRGFDGPSIDHVLLVVINCGLRSRHPTLDQEHDDKRSYEITCELRHSYE